MAHSYTNLTFHIVYGTRERRPFIDEEFQPMYPKNVIENIPPHVLRQIREEIENG